LGGLVYAVYVFIDIDSRSHSVSDTMINFGFKLLIIAAVYSLIATLASRYPKAFTRTTIDIAHIFKKAITPIFIEDR
jgi:hypothetical protein